MNDVGFFSMLILILAVYFLIVKPLTGRNRRNNYYGDDHRYEEDRPYNRGRGYGPNYSRDYRPGGYYGPRGMGMGGGFGGIGAFAGGLAAGALLTQLFEQGRIGFDQYQHLQQLEDHEAIQELMDQNILQEQEIHDLQEQADFDHDADFGGGDDNWV